jgi:DNA polymerase mu
VTHRESTQPIKASAQNFDNLDKAFVIFKLPGKDRRHRRVDLISSPRERYAAAVLSWSGSMMFERDLKYVPSCHMFYQSLPSLGQLLRFGVRCAAGMTTAVGKEVVMVTVLIN